MSVVHDNTVQTRRQDKQASNLPKYVARGLGGTLILNSQGNYAVEDATSQDDDKAFAEAIAAMRKNGAPVAAQVGKHQEALDSLNRQLKDGLSAVEQALLLITMRNPQVAKHLTAVEREAESSDFKIGKNGKKVLATFSEDEMEALPAVEFQIAGILQAATVSLLFSEAGTGKTFLSLDLSEHIARGMDWLGRRTKQGDVLYIYAESKLGLKPRLLAWKKHHEASTSPHIRFIPRPVQLVGERQLLLDTIAEQEVIPSFIVIDTFSNCAIGTNQNNQDEVFKALATAHEIVREYGAHVMVIHHTNRQDTVNGSAAFRNHVDTMIKLSQSDKDGPITMHCEKQRDADEFDDITLARQVITLYTDPATLEPVTSCVIVASAAIARTALLHTEQRMIDILTLLGRASYGQWQKECEQATVVKHSSFDGYVKRLVEQKRVTKESAGKGKPTWYEVTTTPTTPE